MQKVDSNLCPAAMIHMVFTLAKMHQTYRIVPQAENGRQKGSVANASEVSKDSLQCFSPDHKEITLYDMSITSRAYAMETFA